MKKIGAVLALLCLAGSANADTIHYGWENGATDLGKTGTVITSNDSTKAYAGARSLKMVDNYSGSSTPQSWICWINGLKSGDQVTASIRLYDDTRTGLPSGSLYGHYVKNNNIIQYSGCPNLGTTASLGNGWNLLSYTWTFDDGLYNTGWVIEARILGDAMDSIWVDDLTVTVPHRYGLQVHTPGNLTIIPEPCSIVALVAGLAGIAFKKRNK